MSVALAPVSARRRALAYLELTKPRIALLVMVTGVPALLMAERGFPAPGLFWGTVLGTVLAAASAASFNHYVDRDIDALMTRTRTRPLPPSASAVARARVATSARSGYVAAASSTVSGWLARSGSPPPTSTTSRGDRKSVV